MGIIISTPGMINVQLGVIVDDGLTLTDCGVSIGAHYGQPVYYFNMLGPGPS